MLALELASEPEGWSDCFRLVGNLEGVTYKGVNFSVRTLRNQNKNQGRRDIPRFPEAFAARSWLPHLPQGEGGLAIYISGIYLS